VRFRAGGRAFKARLTAVGGHIFDFAVTPSPRDVAFARWEGEPDVRLLSDPEAVNAPPFVEPLPEPWLRFLAGDPETHPSWTLHGPGAAHRITMDAGEFLVLAECRGDAFLLWRLGPKPGAPYLLVGHDGVPEHLRGDFREIIASEPEVGRG
jgi:hypothetical protein